MKKCLYCLEDLDKDSTLLKYLFYRDVLCVNCRKNLITVNKTINIRHIPTYVFYLYNTFFEKIITQYKDSGDSSLITLFQPQLNYIKKYYPDLAIVIAPSNKKRLYHPIKYLLKNFEVLDVFTKTSNTKQASQNRKNRHKIQNHIFLTNIPKQKTVIFFDDVVTSGYTLQRCIQLLESNGIKVIPIILALHENHDEYL